MKKLFEEEMKTWLPVPEQKKENLKKLFSLVAPWYPLVSRILSCGRDIAWKKNLVRQLPWYHKPVCLDIACGTGDICFLLAERYPQGNIKGVDFCEEMLIKARAKNCFSYVDFLQDDINQLVHIGSSSIDILTGGYALRNAPDLDVALQEVFRVLKKGGTAAFLDFSKPGSKVLQKVQYIILKIWGSLWGIVFHGKPEVYAYLAESLALFPDRYALYAKLEKHGFRNITRRLFFAGMLEITICTKGS